MTLEDCRRFFAEEVRFAAGLTSPDLVEAFARVPREKFLGPGPWQIPSGERLAMAVAGLGAPAYLTATDPRDLCHNVLVAVDAARGLNNGQPSALATWIQALDLEPGDRVFHLGCGVGYYTAILAELAGPGGSVVACEVDAALAARARENLADYPNVAVHAADGAVLDPGPCDAMLINAGVTHPHPAWLERLREGGRMVLPLTFAAPGASGGAGIMAKIVRQGSALAAQATSIVAIYSCTSVRDPELASLLAKALGSRALLKLKSVRLDPHAPSDSCLVHGHDLCLSSAECL